MSAIASAEKQVSNGKKLLEIVKKEQNDLLTYMFQVSQFDSTILLSKELITKSYNNLIILFFF